MLTVDLLFENEKRMEDGNSDSMPSTGTLLWLNKRYSCSKASYYRYFDNM